MIALLASLLLPAGEPFAESVLRMRIPDTRLALRDMDGDSLTDIVELTVAGVSLHRLDGARRYGEKAEGFLAWPHETVCWDLADMDGDGNDEVVLLVDGSSVRMYEPAPDGSFGAGVELLGGIAGVVPRGVRRMNLVHDVDGDGRADLVLPGASRYLVYLARDGGFAAPVAVSFDPEISIRVGDPDSLDERFGQDIVIPWFSLRDVDGDGRMDVTAENDEELAVYLADPELPERPSWTLDLRALRAEGDRPERVDLDDLLSIAQPDVAWRVADLDGVAPWELVLQQGARFRLFLGGSRGPDLEHPDQVLKASGNVLYHQLRDVNGDGRQDLQIVRAEKISLGRVLRWLIISGSLDFDVFTYHNESGLFAKKPAERRTLTLRIPALLGFIDELQEFDEKYEERASIPAQAASLDGDLRFNDIVDLRDGELLVFRDLGPDEPPTSLVQKIEAVGDVDAIVEQFVLRDLDRLDEGGGKTIDLGNLDSLLNTPGHQLRQLTTDHEPALSRRIPLAQEGPLLLRVQDLDADGVSDFLIIGRDESDAQVVAVFVSSGS